MDFMSKRLEPVLRHVVLFAFKGTPEEVQQVEAAFCRLPAQIAAIRAFEWGTDVSVENIQQGFTHCFLLSFASAADRDTYLVHPAHQAFGALIQPVLDKVLVVDYWVR
jgi:hypothetical protein